MIGGQSVHRVKDDGLDARLPALLVAVVQDGIQETLGLARAGPGGDQRRLRLAATLSREALEGALLVHVGHECRADRKRRLHLRRNFTEGQAQVDVRPLEQAALLFLQECQQFSFQITVLEIEGRGQVVEDGGANFRGKGERDHLAIHQYSVRTCSSKSWLTTWSRHSKPRCSSVRNARCHPHLAK